LLSGRVFRGIRMGARVAGGGGEVKGGLGVREGGKGENSVGGVEEGGRCSFGGCRRGRGGPK